MKSTPPQFSVVIPTWNDVSHLQRSLWSVLRQSFEDFELLVVDDGSTDSTRSRIEAISDPRIRYIHQEHKGVARARNRGIEAAHGEYITFLDSDDEAYPDWLESFAKAFREDRVALVCCGLLVQGIDGDMQRQLPETGSTLFDDNEVLFLAGTFAVQRGLLVDSGGYNVDLSFSENTDLGIRLVQACTHLGQKIKTVRRPLLTYYPRQSSHLGFRRQRQLDRLAAIESLLADYPNRFQRDTGLLEVHLTLAGATAIRAGQPDKSHRFFHQALRLRPWSWKHYLRWLISYLPGIRSLVWKP